MAYTPIHLFIDIFDRLCGQYLFQYVFGANINKHVCGSI